MNSEILGYAPWFGFSFLIGSIAACEFRAVPNTALLHVSFFSVKVR
jgi:hypothetical protein